MDYTPKNKETEQNPLGFSTQTLIFGGATIATHLIAEYFFTSWEQDKRTAYEGGTDDSQMVNNQPGTGMSTEKAYVHVAHDKILPTILIGIAGILGYVAGWYVSTRTSAPDWVADMIFGVSTGLLVNSASNFMEILNIKSTYRDEWGLYQALTPPTNGA